MKIGFAIIQIFFILKSFECEEQKCRFVVLDWSMTSLIYGTKKDYFGCRLVDAVLIDHSTPVTTNTDANPRSNDDVELIYYKDNVVKVLSTTIFDTFPNTEYFCIDSGQHFEIMKPEYLNNAKKLKVFQVFNNSIARLDANVFAQAPNLEHINLRRNKIVIIHKLAFNGLSHLKGLYLVRNKIKKLHPNTFSELLSLKSLDLWYNSCINKNFPIVKSNFEEVEEEIEKNCEYDPRLFESHIHDEDEESDVGNSTAISSLAMNDTKDMKEGEGDLVKIEKIFDEKLKNVNENLVNTAKKMEVMQGDIHKTEANILKQLQVMLREIKEIN